MAQPSRSLAALTASDRLMAFYLREPLARSRRILRRNRRFLARLETSRNTPLTVGQLRCRFRSVLVPRQDQYRRLTATGSGSRILACFHYGDFIYGLARLLRLEPRGRNVLVYSQQQFSSALRANLGAFGSAAAGPPVRQLLAHQAGALELAEQLRAGNCTLLMFCDLPRSFGSGTEVVFLQRRAQFTRGLALLALSTGTDVIPVINQQRGKARVCHLGRRILSGPQAGETLAAAGSRITQQLVDFFEPYFLACPHQWRFLPLLPGFFADSAPAPGADACRGQLGLEH